MTARDLAGKLCKDLVHGVYERDGRAFIATTFPYPTGDLVTLYVVDRDGETFLSDEGMTCYWLAADGIDLTDARSDFIRSACLLHNVTFDGEAFFKRIGGDPVGADLLALCQAIARVSTLRYDRSGRATQTLSTEVETLIDGKIAPNRPYTPRWTDRDYDPGASHLVDYHFNGTPADAVEENVPSNVFVAGSRERIEVVTGIILFWQQNLPDFKSMCVIPAEIDVSGSTRDRLRSAADLVVPGVGGHEQKIVSFALSKRRFVPAVLVGNATA